MVAEEFPKETLKCVESRTDGMGKVCSQSTERNGGMVVGKLMWEGICHDKSNSTVAESGSHSEV